MLFATVLGSQPAWVTFWFGRPRQGDGRTGKTSVNTADRMYATVRTSEPIIKPRPFREASDRIPRLTTA